jgi:hypothetical protein
MGQISLACMIRPIGQLSQIRQISQMQILALPSKGASQFLDRQGRESELME